MKSLGRKEWIHGRYLGLRVSGLDAKGFRVDFLIARFYLFVVENVPCFCLYKWSGLPASTGSSGYFKLISSS